MVLRSIIHLRGFIYYAKCMLCKHIIKYDHVSFRFKLSKNLPNSIKMIQLLNETVKRFSQNRI